MARSALHITLIPKVVKITATVELCTADGTVVGTTEADLTPDVSEVTSFGGQIVSRTGPVTQP